MDIAKYLKSRPNLYHLTAKENLAYILKEKKLFSTAFIAEKCKIKDAYKFLTTKRGAGCVLKNGEIEYRIRDQKPVSERVLRRSLEDGCTFEEYLILLNSRVFFWPTTKRLWSHYLTYEDEKPALIRVSAQELFKINYAPQFSRLNSGATRCSSHWNGNAPERGFNTFLKAEEFGYLPSNVAEVTFLKYCQLTENIYISERPDGKFIKM